MIRSYKFKSSHDVRQSGRSTRLMLASPRNAVYIWPDAQLDYPKRLAKDIGREDLEIVSLNWIRKLSFRGRILHAVVIDHDTRLNSREWTLVEEAKYNASH